MVLKLPRPMIRISSDFVPTRQRCKPQRRRFATIAHQTGKDIDVFRLETLITQHLQRVDDELFCRSTDSLVRPPLRTWSRWRHQLTAGFGIQSFLPIVTEISRIGLQSRGYAALAAGVTAFGPLLTMTLHKMPIYAQHHVLLAIGGDAIGAAFPGGPGGGKIFTLWMKPVSLSTMHQSPSLAIPILVCLGGDSGARLARVCAEWKPNLSRLPAFIPLGAGCSAVPVVFMTGDFAFCTSILTIPRCNRPFPSTAGRIHYFSLPLCWHCGVGGVSLYNRNLWRSKEICRTRLVDPLLISARMKILEMTI